MATLSSKRIPRTVDAISVSLSRIYIWQVAMPDEAGHLRQIGATLISVFIKQAQLDPLRDLGEKRKIRPGTVVRRAQRVRISGPDSHSGLTQPLSAIRVPVAHASLWRHNHEKALPGRPAMQLARRPG